MNKYGIETLIFIGIIAFSLYFIPTFVAMGKKYFSGIFLLNLFLGWTFLGWVGSLIWAVSSPRKQEFGKIIRPQFENYDLTKDNIKNFANSNTLTENKSIPPPFEAKKNEPLKRNKPTLAEWRKENPMKSINDYYAKFGT